MSAKDEVEVQETDAPENEGQAPDSGTQDGPETFDREYVTKLRSEAAKWRQQFKDAKEKLSTLEQAEMSEKEKLQAKLDAEAKARGSGRDGDTPGAWPAGRNQSRHKSRAGPGTGGAVGGTGL
jgi:hypothetical protein